METKFEKYNIEKEFKTVYNTIRKYISFCLKSEEQINEYVPNTHIAEVFKDVLIQCELESMYPEKYHKIPNSIFGGADFVLDKNKDQYEEKDGKFYKKGTFSVSFIDKISDYFNNKRLKEGGTEEVHKTYQKLREKDDYIRNNLKIIPTYLDDNYNMRHNSDLKSQKIRIK